MSRPAKFDTDSILDATRTLLLQGGPRNVTAQGAAGLLGAPSGSIYHRFPSRDALALEVWLRSVERFQAGLPATTTTDDPVSAAVRGAVHVVHWCRQHLDDARVLVLYQPTDLLREPWPADAADRLRAQARRVENYLQDLCRGLGTSSKQDRRVIQFAVIDVPYAAVRPSLLRGRPPEPLLDGMVEETARHTLNLLVERRSSQ